MPTLLVRSPGSQGLTLELKAGAYRIGRGLGNDFQIDHPSVSVAHCELMMVNGALVVRDLGSTNGTFIDHQRITEATLLFGQVLQVGIVELILAEPLRISRPRADGTVGPLEIHAWRICSKHADLEASFTCPHCQQDLCARCVRGLARMDGSRIKVCPDCGNECEETHNLPMIQEPTEDQNAIGSGKVLRAGLWPHLADWLRGKLVQGFLYQRRKLLEAQDLAARQAMDFDQRLAAVQIEMRERIREYEQRIEELEQELAAAELEKRELIRNQIILIKRALAEERTNEQAATGQARTFSCTK
jgi:hypothetical protein